MRTPITYYGGKQKLIKELLPLLPGHRLYIEPFMGGGALFFAKQPSKAEVINDLNGNVTNFYQVTQSQFSGLKKLIDGTLHSRAIHKEAKYIYENPTEFDNIKRAWAFWVVTNQGFAGKIGSWAIGKQDNKIGKTLANKRDGFTNEYAKRLQYVQIENKDALSIIRQYDGKDVFFYLDPPYFNSDCGHYKGYSEADYKKLLDSLKKITGRFLLSSYPSEVLKEYAKENGWYYREITQKIAVTHLTGKQKTEVLVCNYPPPHPVPMQNPAEKSKQDRALKVPSGYKNIAPSHLQFASEVRNFDVQRESPLEKKQLSLEYCKKVLEKSGKKYTDEEVLKIRQLLYRVGNLEYQLFTQLKTRQDGKHTSLRKSKHGRTGSQRDKYPLSERKAGTVLSTYRA